MTRFWISLSLLLLAGGLDLLLPHPDHTTFWWHSVPAFDLLYGLGGCVVLILGAHWLGHHWLQRQASYYDEEP